VGEVLVAPEQAAEEPGAIVRCSARPARTLGGVFHPIKAFRQSHHRAFDRGRGCATRSGFDLFDLLSKFADLLRDRLDRFGRSMLGLLDPTGQFLNAFEHGLGRQCRGAARRVVLARGIVIVLLFAMHFAGPVRIVSVVGKPVVGIVTLRTQFFRCRRQDCLGQPAADIDAAIFAASRASGSTPFTLQGELAAIGSYLIPLIRYVVPE